MTKLIRAASEGKIEVVKWLLKDGGANTKAVDNNGNTALLHAAAKGHLAVVQWLLKEGGACIKEMDNNGSTALMKAADKWHLVVVQWLLMEGGEYVSDELWRRLRPNNPAVLFEDTHTHQEPSYYLSM